MLWQPVWLLLRVSITEPQLPRPRVFPNPHAILLVPFGIRRVILKHSAGYVRGKLIT